MTPETFCQLRQSFSCYRETFGKLFHPPVDAALIAYWESGDIPIPRRIAAQLLRLNTLFQTALRPIIAALQARQAPRHVPLPFYLCEEDLREQDPEAYARFQHHYPCYAAFMKYVYQALALRGYHPAFDYYFPPDSRNTLADSVRASEGKDDDWTDDDLDRFIDDHFGEDSEAAFPSHESQDPRLDALTDHQSEMLNLQIEREITRSTVEASPRANENLSPAAQAYQALQSQGCDNPTPSQLASAIAAWKAQHQKTDERRLDILGLATPID